MRQAVRELIGLYNSSAAEAALVRRWASNWDGVACSTRRFKTDQDNELLCSKELNEDELEEFREALAADYYFQASLVRRQQKC